MDTTEEFLRGMGKRISKFRKETGLTQADAYTGLNLPHAREKPATSPENFRHLAGEGCQCKRETTYCEEHTKNV